MEILQEPLDRIKDLRPQRRGTVRVAGRTAPLGAGRQVECCPPLDELGARAVEHAVQAQAAAVGAGRSGPGLRGVAMRQDSAGAVLDSPWVKAHPSPGGTRTLTRGPTTKHHLIAADDCPSAALRLRQAQSSRRSTHGPARGRRVRRATRQAIDREYEGDRTRQRVERPGRVPVVPPSRRQEPREDDQA